MLELTSMQFNGRPYAADQEEFILLSINTVGQVARRTTAQLVQKPDSRLKLWRDASSKSLKCIFEIKSSDHFSSPVSAQQFKPKSSSPVSSSPVHPGPVRPAQFGSAHFVSAQINRAQIGSAQFSRAQFGSAQFVSAQISKAQFGPKAKKKKGQFSPKAVKQKKKKERAQFGPICF